MGRDELRATYVQALVELLLLLVYYAEAEVYFVGLLEVGLHAHNLGKGLFGVFKRAIAVVQDANAIPELWFLQLVSIKSFGDLNECDVPWDPTGGRELADRQSRPVAGHPSSDSNVLMAH